jgi:acetyl esterase/lipase
MVWNDGDGEPLGTSPAAVPADRASVLPSADDRGMPLRDRMDPELVEGLDGFLEATGPRGLAGIADPVERRRTFLGLMEAGGGEPDPRVATEDLRVAGPAGAPDVRVRSYRPVGLNGPLPALFYIHGGGMVIGAIESEDAIVRARCLELGCAAVSVDYRLAPENPHPAPVEDCYAALSWMAAEADRLVIDAGRIAIYGGSAGGGLAAGTALLARDRGGPALAFQMLLYPMLDDRCDTPSGNEVDDIGVFDGWASREGFEALLGERSGTDEVDHYAAPTRCPDLTGLPPTWIDVGELDALRDESIDYAQRLLQAGVPTELHINAGCFHASEVFVPDAASSRRIVAARVEALRRAFS